MDPTLEKRLFQSVKEEPFARKLGLELKEVRDGYARIEMVFDPGTMGNIYSMAHGGAVFGLIDEAFEIAANSHGWIEVALNVSITYVSAPEPGSVLKAEAKLLASSRKTATYLVQVMDQNDRIIATSQALAYRIDKVPPFAGTE